MIPDLRYAFRTLAKSPIFALTAIAALALGIGANSAIFSLVNQILLNPPGIKHPERVLALRVKYDKLNLTSIGPSAPDYADVRNSTDIFDRAALSESVDFNRTGDTAPERLQGANVTSQFFDVYGARPVLGRLFTPEEDQPNANNVVILSHATWQRLFGGDPGVLNRTLQLNQKPYRIVGVMGPDFRWPREVELWAPLGLEANNWTEDNRFNERFFAIARIRDGVPRAKAEAYVTLLADRLRQGKTRNAAFARDAGWGMFAVPVTEIIAGDTKKPMLILLAAVGLVLLIACANIAGLMLARASARSREFAVRVALGAGRLRLLRQTLAESMVLALCGAVLGIVLAQLGMKLILLLAPEGAVSGLTATMDGNVLLFTAAVTIAAALLFGFVPAWSISQIRPYETLKASGRTGSISAARQRLRSGLVVLETALALVLLFGAGLFLRSLGHLQQVSPGFDPNGIMTGMLSLPATRYDNDEKRIAFYQAVNERLTATPGVTAAAAILTLPFSGNASSASFNIEGKPTGPGEPGPHGDIRLASPGYFEALRIPLKRGRFFNNSDRLNTQSVAVIDENLARQYWPNEDPIGKRIRNGSDGKWSTIVGIVGHVNHSDLAADSGKGTYYYSLYQAGPRFAWFVLRTDKDPASFGSALQQAVRDVDPNQPVHNLKTMQDLVATSLAPRRFILRLLEFFAGVALFMAALGLYGIISYSVTQRTQEIGIRMALGARQGSVVGLIVGQGLRLAAAGVVLGVIASLACSRLLQNQLSGVSALDPLTLVVTAVILIAAALLASYLPALRATRVDPLEALRYE